MKVLNAAILLALISISDTGVAASQSSADLRPLHMVAQQQVTTTQANNGDVHALPKIIDPAYGGGIACEDGYALTTVTSTPETRDDVKVFGECNGLALAGWAHTWCKNSPTVYQPVKEAPTSIYVCKKIVNKWEAVA